MVVDARGVSCPQPVLMTKNALAKEANIEVLVDNNTAMNNIKRFATSQGATVEVKEEGEDYRIVISK